MTTPPGPVPPDGTPPGSGHVPDGRGDGGDGGRDGNSAGDGDEGNSAGDGDRASVDAVGDGDEGTGGDPLRFHRWMRSSASGGILTGIALGFQHALEERREQPAFVMEAPGEPEDPDAPISLHFDPDDPTKTVAVIRAPSHDGPRDDQPPPSDVA